MRVIGVHCSESSAPQQPVTCVMCRLQGAALMLDGLAEFDAPDSMQNLLRSDGPWVVGIAAHVPLPREFGVAAAPSSRFAGHIVREASDGRIAIAAAPVSLAERLIGTQRYRGAEHGSTPAERAEILDALDGQLMRRASALRLVGIDALRGEFLHALGGGRIDALLAAVQAATAWSAGTRGGRPETLRRGAKRWLAENAGRLQPAPA